MASKRRLRRRKEKQKAVCNNKQVYPSEHDAMRAKRGFRRNRDPWIRYYKCDICHMYHLTHTKPKIKIKIHYQGV